MTRMFTVPFASVAPTFLTDAAAQERGNSAASSVAVAFDEGDYLARYPEVVGRIAAGEFADAEDHWLNMTCHEPFGGRYILLPNDDFSIYCQELDTGVGCEADLIVVVGFAENDDALLRGLANQSERGFRFVIVVAEHERADAGSAVATHSLSDHLIAIVSPESLHQQLRTLARQERPDWFVFLDGDIELVPDAVRYVRRAPLERTEGCAAVYLDEGIVAPSGERLSFRKPCWSPVHFLASGYACGFALFDPGFLAEALDHVNLDVPLPFELMLHALRTEAAVGHLDWVASWSAWNRRRLEPAADQVARLRARVGEVVAELMPDWLPSQSNDPLYLPELTAKHLVAVSIIVPTADRDIIVGGDKINLLDRLIDTVMSYDPHVIKEFVLVHNDDMSADRRVELTARGCRLVLFDDPVFNFSRKINLGASVASHDIFLLMNDDVQATGDWIGESCGYLHVPAVGAVGVRLLFPDGSLQHGGCGIFKGSPLHVSYCMPRGGRGSYAGMIDTVREVAGVTAACMLTHRRVFERLGGFDEALPDLYNDADYCLRLREAGYSVVYSGRSSLYHFESVSLDPTRIHGDQQLLFEAKWGTNDGLDPFYSPVISRWRPYRWDPPPLTGATDRWVEFGTAVEPVPPTV